MSSPSTDVDTVISLAESHQARQEFNRQEITLAAISFQSARCRAGRDQKSNIEFKTTRSTLRAKQE